MQERTDNGLAQRMGSGLALRVLDDRDLPALRRLAERDSSPPPESPVLGAELDGVLVAAVALADRPPRPVADPFLPTERIVNLLELWANQLRPHAGSRGRRTRTLHRIAAVRAPAPVQASSSGAIVSPAEASCSQ